MAASMEVVCPGNSPIKIVKWKVKKDSMVMKGAVLAVYEEQKTGLQLKLKSTAAGIVNDILVEAGMESNPGSVLVMLRQQKLGGCTHPTVMKDMCADCGADLRREPGIAGDCKEVMSASVAMVHNIPELIVSQEQALELGREDEQRLLKTRKLVLLVDLDQTLIHTTNDNIPPHLKGVHHFQMWQGPHATWYHTRLRPYIRRFLERVSEMYELHICTFGVRLYAHIVARLIDPDEKFFSHRILSRDECFDPLSKTANLKALFPCGDAMVCIIDDREDVWNMAPNLVHVKPYRFFQGTADINAPPGLGKTEHDDIPIVHKVIDQHENTSDTKEEKMDKTAVDYKSNETAITTSERTDVEISSKEMDEEMSENLISGSKEHATGDIVEETESGSPSSVVQTCITDGAETEEACKTRPVVQKCPSKSTSEEVAQVMVSTIQNDSTGKTLTELQTSTLESRNPDKKLELEDKLNENEAIHIPHSRAIHKDQLKEDLSVSSDSESEDFSDARSEKEGGAVSTTFTDSQGKDKSFPLTGGHNPSQSREEVKMQVTEGKDRCGEIPEQSPEVENKEKEELKPVHKETKTDSRIACDGVKNMGKSVQMEVTSVSVKENKKEKVVKKTEEMEWDDKDDYLLHLEEILTRIHRAFYSMVEEGHLPSTKESLPDLKSIIPYVKRKTLKDCNIVFSGLVPLNTNPEKSQAFVVARALGATIQEDVIGPRHTGKEGQITTHLVATKPGTRKHKMAMRTRGVYIVSSAWLWACAERWERCDERLFPLASLMQKHGETHFHIQRERKRKIGKNNPKKDETSGEASGAEKRPKTSNNLNTDEHNKTDSSTDQHSDEGLSHSSEQSDAAFADSVHPLLSFSDEDLECMDKEVDELMAEEVTGSEDETDDERDERYRSTVLGSQNESGSSSESLSGEFPRGWGLRRKSKSSPHASDDDLEKRHLKVLEAETEDTENELERFQKTVDAFSPDSDSNTSVADSIGSVDDEIAEAVEKEFLASM